MQRSTEDISGGSSPVEAEAPEVFLWVPTSPQFARDFASLSTESFPPGNTGLSPRKTRTGGHPSSWAGTGWSAWRSPGSWVVNTLSGGSWAIGNDWPCSRSRKAQAPPGLGSEPFCQLRFPRTLVGEVRSFVCRKRTDFLGA